VGQFSIYLSLVLSLFLAGNVLGEETVLVVYTAPQSRVYFQGDFLGESGKPFRLKVPPGQDITLVIVADGYESREVLLNSADLRKTHRIPDQGVLALEKKGSLVLPLGGLIVLLVIGYILAQRRKNRPQDSLRQAIQTRFEIGPLVGEGATAQVFAATSKRYPQRSLAVKVLKSESTSGDPNRARLLRSLEKSLELRHPNLVKLYESGETPDGKPYILMELLRGESLEDLLDREGPPTPDRVIQILSPLCDVLQYLHERTITHRDVKPENIFLTKNGVLKLMDLEISRSADSRDLTQTGAVIGTPLYLSPEHIRGSAVPASDQYAVGVILYEMIAGKRPFQSSDPLDIINMHLQDTPPSLAAFTSSSLQEAVVMKMLAKDFKNRFPDMKAAKEAIEEAFRENSEDDLTATTY
jgi:serine/threonine protein kinase